MIPNNKCVLFLIGLLSLAFIGCGPYEEPVHNDNDPAPTTRVPNPNNRNNNNEEEPEPEDPDNASEPNQLIVNDHIVPGPSSILVSSAVVQRASWIVVYEDDNGELGSVAGSYRIDGVGSFQNIVVSLDRNAIDGESFHAQLHADMGRLRVLELPEPDVAVENTQGQPVRSTFIISVPDAPEITVENEQLIDPIDMVVIDKVHAQIDGWIAIFTSNAGNPDEYIGHANVSKGDNEDIEVKLTRYLIHEESLIAVLYSTNAGVDVFDPSNSALEPVVYDSKTIQMPFQVLYPEELYPVIETQPLTTTAESVDTLIIPSVVAPADGFLSVYPNGNLVNPAIISVAIQKGLNTDTEITLPEANTISANTSLFMALQLQEGQTLFFDGQAVSRRMDIEFVEEIFPAIETLNQNLTRLTTVVEIEAISTPEPAWVVIYSNANNEADEILGYRAVEPGVYSKLSVALTRPSVPNEILHAKLHTNAGDNSLFEFPDGPDSVLLDSDGNAISSTFTLTHASGIPDIRLTVDLSGNSYQWTEVEPAIFGDSIDSSSTLNQPITFKKGWRYEIRNLTSAHHPLEIVNVKDGANTVLISQQNPGAGSVAGDPQVALQIQVGGSTFRFTYAPSMSTDTELIYRCTFHPQTMKADIASQD